ncbi:uncharacterized protein LOC122512303 [Leptopilina heterotoma]|uniref:uncharacterized protein LOC122512303 n=1 Tax=Leptopilina heterotoma TaxID=63436 RepID=UPI001CA8E31C|nr:uncharacterized protein LOC122512303 [Leptopilina heterotoma]
MERRLKSKTSSMSQEENVSNAKRPRMSRKHNVNNKGRDNDESVDLTTKNELDSEAEEESNVDQEIDHAPIEIYSSSDEEDCESEKENNEDERPIRTMFQGFASMAGMLVPLKNYAQLASIDHLLLELTVAVRYNNTYDQLLRRLQLLKKTYVHINVPTSKNALWKTIGRDDSSLVYRLYCEMCQELVGNGKNVERNCKCGACGPHKEETCVGTFIQVRLAPQIKEFLDSPKAAEALRYKERRVKTDPNALEDVFDGREYKHLSEDGFLRNRNNFTLSFWTDKLNLTKSSKSRYYPFLLQLNELSPLARQRNMFLAGLWIGKQDPNMGEIMEPIVDDINELYDVGIRWKPDGEQEVLSKFVVAFFTTSSVVQPMVLRMNQHFEEFGCLFCFAKGKCIGKERIYDSTVSDLRTWETMKEDITKVMKTEKESRGVVGCSRLATLRTFDLIKGQVVDNVNNDYLGNAKKFNQLFLKNVGKPWYIGKRDKIKEVDNILTKIAVPSILTISKKPRSINTSNSWKASEWRNYLLYFSLPCLDEILPEPYFSHLAKYSEAMFILNSASISNTDLMKAKRYLDDFVNDTQKLYGEINMQFSVHFNRHSVFPTENWGPAWVFSTLPYQSMCTPIADSIITPKHRAEQFVTRFFMKKFVLRTAEQEKISNVTRKEIYDLLDKKNVESNFVGEGTPRKCHASSEVIQLINAKKGKNEKIENTIVSYFQKATINGVSYAIKMAKQKFCNHIAYCHDKKFIVIKNIISYQQGRETTAGFIAEELKDLGGAYNTEYIRFVEPTKNNVFISYLDVSAPGILIKAKKGTVAVHLCNCLETD